MLGTAVWASFITYWPYNLSLTLKNYDFSTFDQSGWASYTNSVLMAALAAIIGTIITFCGAYLVEKTKVRDRGQAIAHLLAMLPMAVPGLVLGLGYVFFVNASWNPLNIFYGTLIVLTVNCVAHFYTVAHITALTALKQIDPEFESGVGLAQGAVLADLRPRDRADSACRRSSTSPSISSSTR